MPTIITTDPESPYDVEIAGVGVMGGNARGGIPAEEAALSLPELQNDDGEPLSGQALRKAAEEFAKKRGFATRTAKEIDIEELRVEGGAFPAGLDIREASRQASERDQLAWEGHQAAADMAPIHTADEVPPQTTATQPLTPTPKED